jgi:hypothetical protein
MAVEKAVMVVGAPMEVAALAVPAVFINILELLVKATVAEKSFAQLVQAVMLAVVAVLAQAVRT